MSMEVDVLRDVKTHLTTYGWTQRRFHKDEGGREVMSEEALALLEEGREIRSCLFGAVILVGARYQPYGTDEWEGLNDRVTNWLMRALPPTFDSVTSFNDSGGTRLEDVLALIDDAIHQATAINRKTGET